MAWDRRRSIRERRWTMFEPAKDKDKSEVAHRAPRRRHPSPRWRHRPGPLASGTAELVLPTKLPDGLLFAWGKQGSPLSRSSSRSRPTPSSSKAEQALRDLLLVYLIRGEVAQRPRVGTPPKGQLRVPDHAHRASSDTATELGGRWRVVELWTIPTQPVLATANPGMMPWVPLMPAAEPPEIVLRRCREVMDLARRRPEHETRVGAVTRFTCLPQVQIPTSLCPSLSTSFQEKMY